MKTYPPHLTVLALDLATTTGFAVLGGGLVTSGSVCFARRKGRKLTPDEHEGIAYIRFQRWVREAIAEYKPEVIAFEEPMGNFKNAAARNIIVGFRGILMSTAAYYDREPVGFPQTKLKQYATGKGNSDKEAMMAAARRMYPHLPFTDDNEADALHVLHLYLEERAA